MNLLKEAGQRLARLRPHRGVSALFLAILFTLIPSLSLASEAGVALKFSNTDYWWLGGSLVLGLVAIGTAVVIWFMTMAVSPGSEKMQAVSQAIKEGALAYLKKQVGTMSIFVVLLAIGLFFLYYSQWGPALGGWIALCFVAGVTSSYVAGFAGMMMAVNGNCRTAAAALTSYKKALETAFRAGSVAGMVTVGMGLIGATLILWLAGPNAMKLLIGFGFGGSLAALFMRVGGGIFTKAADVGADLVGKVEAGIPEDDARNPATIADNVGDNVGDCAGMAADIFESYEVTLVAAIILGAATASIFDQSTWMKLVLFALMARGAGIVASIFGVVMVRGSDNVDADPLKPISVGFRWSALAAALLTIGLAFWMMSGVKTSRLVPLESYDIAQTRAVWEIRDAYAKAHSEKPEEVAAKDIQNDPRIVAMDLGPDKSSNSRNLQHLAQMGQMIQADPAAIQEPQPLVGYSKVDFAAAESDPDNKLMNKILSYAVTIGPGAAPEELRQKFANKSLSMYHLEVTQPELPASPQDKVDYSKTVTNQAIVGPFFVDEKGVNEDVDHKLEQLRQNHIEIKKLDNIPVALYTNPDGDLVLGIDGKVDNFRNLNIQPVFSYYQRPVEAVEKAQRDSANDRSVVLPPSRPLGIDQMSGSRIPKGIALIDHTPVDWWRFPLCLIFGIVMAFLIERLTDYYVSLHGKPVQEVAGTSTTGPATMIITVFAYGMESSVFSVFAIVVALIAPLLIFPPSVFGGYILSFYGIALVGLGLLTTTGFILAMDTFGPISDNAQGVYEMSGEGHDNEAAAKAVQRLDAAGNTTKALTKGFAIATAVVAAVALFHSYLEEGHLTATGLRLDIPEIFLGMLIGGAAPYLFSAFSINAVGRAAFKLINEVRAQFRGDPGIMAGTSKPNYGRCVAIVTQAAQQELLGPGILAIALPAAVAFGFSIGKPTVGGLNLTGAQALGGYLAGAILSGQLLAVLLANSGGIWDNSKKFIEDGAYGGKGSEAHKAGVVCDTVGDPFKDTAGPALNPLIKVMNLVALLLAPVVIQPLGNPVLITITVVCVAALAFSVYWSKRASLSSELSSLKEEAKAIEAPEIPAPAAEKRITVDEEEPK